MFLPCVCDLECKDRFKRCEFVKYHPQDIKKGEHLAKLAGFNGAVLAYKKCDFCKFVCSNEG